GLMLPPVSLGLWHNFGSTGCYETMREMCFTAFDNGITHFDLANNYGPEPGSAERNFGRILNEELKAYRDEIIVSTKAGYEMWDGPYGDHGSRKYLIASLDQSLARLGLDYVDIFYHHRMDMDTPLEETMIALYDIVRSGKALYVGLSNYNGERMLEASAILKEMCVPFIINQNRYSIYDRTIEKNGLKEACRKDGKGIICFSPLAQGLLTDRYLNGIPADSRMRTDGRFLNENALSEERLKSIRALNELALSRGQTLAQMALSWVLKDDVITSVLIGASKPAQILENLKCVNQTTFTEAECRLIDENSL
ncbi:MAG: aldo/keto reductase, partial [Clostridia bacterium]|nr:aldo/keto reductase [Clostridia bacterium]